MKSHETSRPLSARGKSTPPPSQSFVDLDDIQAWGNQAAVSMAMSEEGAPDTCAALEMALSLGCKEAGKVLDGGLPDLPSQHTNASVVERCYGWDGFTSDIIRQYAGAGYRMDTEGNWWSANGNSERGDFSFVRTDLTEVWVNWEDGGKTHTLGACADRGDYSTETREVEDGTLLCATSQDKENGISSQTCSSAFMERLESDEGFAQAHVSPYNLMSLSHGGMKPKSRRKIGYEDYDAKLKAAGGVNGVCTRYHYMEDNPAAALTSEELDALVQAGKEPPPAQVDRVVYATTSESSGYEKDPTNPSEWKKTTWTSGDQVVYVHTVRGGEVTEEFGPQFDAIVEKLPALKAQHEG